VGTVVCGEPVGSVADGPGLVQAPSSTATAASAMGIFGERVMPSWRDLIPRSGESRSEEAGEEQRVRSAMGSRSAAPHRRLVSPSTPRTC
jgi:hypothetical protein